MFVEAKCEFNKPKSLILDIIKEPSNLTYFHPFCKRNDPIKWPGHCSIDELEYLNGRILIRDFINWHENGYDLNIGPKNKSKIALVNWIVSGNEMSSSLRVRINPKIKYYSPFRNKFLQWLTWHFYIRPMLQNYINNVMNGFEYFINKDELVKPNQFGTHRWFS